MSNLCSNPPPASHKGPLPAIILLTVFAAFLFGCEDSLLDAPQTHRSAEVSGIPRLGISPFAAQTTGLIPLIDMADTTYFGFEGGLYPDGSNTMPEAHRHEALQRTQHMEPLDTLGIPDPVGGKIVMLSVGMSQTAEEFCERDYLEDICNEWSFMGKAEDDPEVNHTTLVLVNGADNGSYTTRWDDPKEETYDRVRDERLTPAGVTEAQVQIVWTKLSNPDASERPSLPDPGADAYEMMIYMGDIIRSLKTRYPRLKLVFITSRSYGGYASLTSNSPEPWAYETGFAMKWMIEAQINQMASGTIDSLAGDLNYDTVAPWIGWGPYWWADGDNPRSDGLSWPREYYDDGGGHLSKTGEDAAAQILLDFFKTSDLSTPWFLAEPPVVAVTLTPRSDPIEIPPEGGDFEFRLTLDNLSDETRDLQYWTTILKPDGGTKNGVDSVAVTLAPGESRTDRHTQTIPGKADPGDYVYYAYAGTFPDVVLAADSLTFVKLE